MATAREDAIQPAPHTSTKTEYEDAFPELPPAPAPDVGDGHNGSVTAHQKSPEASSMAKGDVWGHGPHAPKKQQQQQQQDEGMQTRSHASPDGSLNRSTMVGATPSHGNSNTYAFTSHHEGSSSDYWEGHQISTGSKGRTKRKKSHNKRTYQPYSKRRNSNPGSGSSLRMADTVSHSPVSFGDDLDERSDDDDLAADDAVGASGRQRQDGRRGKWVRLAPWNTPMHRRLQTAVVLLHCLGMGLMFSLFCFLCSIPLLWPLIAIYLIYIRFSTAGTDGVTSWRLESFRRARIWRHFAAYFPARLHKTADLPPTRKYILAVHPHGIISHGAWAAFATEALGFSEQFPGITNSLLTLNGNFKTPFYREYLLAMGLQSVSRNSIINLLTKGGGNGEGMGRAVSIVVGGAREALEGQPRTMRLIISRKGFCRMAVRTGADLVPVLAFGENDLYSQWSQRDHPRFHRLQMRALSLMGFSVPVLQGRGVFNYDFGILPHRRPLNVVVGAPIKVEQVRAANVSAGVRGVGGVGGPGSGGGGRNFDEETEVLHKLYVEKLLELYNEHKDVYFRDRKEDIHFVG